MIKETSATKSDSEATTTAIVVAVTAAAAAKARTLMQMHCALSRLYSRPFLN